MKTNKSYRFTPLLMAISVIVGVVIGTFYANHFSGNRLNIINSGSNRLNNLLHIIDDQYVDEVNIDSLVDMAIPQILSDLDPHSVYISAADVQKTQDDLKGSFSGIGVEFIIRQDTIHVQNVIKNGPAQQAGILAGDKIVSVDDKPFVGKIVTNEEAMRRLKGAKGTKVKVGVKRYGSNAVKYFTITRADIPQKSITAVYMLDDNTGYIKIKNFGENTYPELLVALAQLSQEGFGNLVIDLRDNTGGYLESAVQMINEFLPKNSRQDRTTRATEGEAIRKYRSSFLSTRLLPPHLKSLLELYRTTTAELSSADVRSARDLCKSKWNFLTAVLSDLLQQDTTLHQDAAYRSHIRQATMLTTKRTCWQDTSMENASRKTASSIPVRHITPVLEERYMEVAV